VSPQICAYVLEMDYLGITAGTSATTYSRGTTRLCFRTPFAVMDPISGSRTLVPWRAEMLSWGDSEV